MFVSMLKDERYERDGDDILCSEEIDFQDLILGTKKNINSLWKNFITIHVI